MKVLPTKDRVIPLDLVLVNQNQLAKLLGICRTTLWKLRKNPDFPKPVEITRKSCGWRAIDVHRWMERKVDQGSAE